MTSPAGTTDNGDNGNGRVTREWMRGELALVTNRIENLTGTVDDLVSLFRADHDKLTSFCTKYDTKFEDIDTLKKAIIGNIVAVIGAILAAVWALIKS